MPGSPIQELVDRLAAIPADRFSRERVLEEIGGIRLEPVSLRPYQYFCSARYTRNLIHRCELFEVVAIGWEVGQVSPVHNHRGQECWMAVPIGRLQVQNFRIVERDPVARTCRLEPSIRFEMDAGNPAAVDPAEPIHSVHNLLEYGGRAVSVHVYSKPFDTCEIYFPDEGRYADITLEYTSRYGTLCPGQQAVAIAS
jgi:cysteine dioxygenase